MDEEPTTQELQRLLEKVDPVQLQNILATMPADWQTFLALRESGSPSQAAIAELTWRAWHALLVADIAFFPSLPPEPSSVRHLAQVVVDLSRTQHRYQPQADDRTEPPAKPARRARPRAAAR